MNQHSKLHITIIGAGASGTTLAINLLHDIHFPATIVLIEKHSSAFNRGVAYSSNLAYEPLNVPAGKMSIRTEKPDDFYDFVVSQKDAKVSKENFVSRRWFGDYLTQRFAEAEQAKHSEVEVIKVTADVSDIGKNEAQKFLVYAGTEQIAESDIVVLATGNETPFAFINENDIPKGKYFNNPWNFDVEKIESDKNIFVIGMGLTMIDIAGSFYQSKHRGKLFAFSRNGKFPCVHTSSANTRHLPLNENETVETVFSIIRNEIKEQSKNNIHWSRVIDGLRPHTVSLWQQFSDNDKTKFLKRIRPFWERHRHRMPPTSNNILNEFKASGGLEIHAGNINNIQWLESENQFEISYTDKAGNRNTLNADYVVNCTGPSTDYHKIQNPLFRNLLNKNWITPDKHLLGIETRANGEVVGAEQNIFAIGPLRKACEWESTAMREVVQQAKMLSSEIIAAHPDMEALLSELKKLSGKDVSLEKVQEIVSLVSPQKLNYQSLLPKESNTNYKRIKLLTGVVECSLIYWSPGTASAIHNHVGYEGLALVLEGNIYESKYRFTDNTLTELQSNHHTAGSILFEKKGDIHRLENAHLSKAAVSLHIYLPPPSSFDNTSIFDEQRKKIGILSADAQIISWNIPATCFKEIKPDAFAFEPLLEFMI